MREEEIKKKAEEYESKFTYSLAIARYFEDGARWALSQPQIIEIFGKRVKVVKDGGHRCKDCAFDMICDNIGMLPNALCENALCITNQHFVEVDEDGNESSATMLR